MPDEPVKKLADLRKRVGRFLDSSTYGRDEIGALLDELLRVGDAAVIGGMLRDIALEGNKQFYSDVDVVVACEDSHSIERILSSQCFPWSKNKFGGYRVTLSKWKMDIWSLENTWAIKERLVGGGNFRDLVKTTFFDWDAIVYEVGTGRIFAVDGYLENLGERRIGINLECNPNPVGNSVKALRYATKYGARFSESLAEYLGNALAPYSAKEICALEYKSHDRPLLIESDVDALMKRLRSDVSHLDVADVRVPNSQYELWPQ